MNLSGKFDGLRGDVAVGWILDLSAPQTPLEIEIMLDDRVIGSGRADLFRQELAGAGQVNPFCGFEIDVSEGLDGRSGVVWARLATARQVVLPGVAFSLNHDPDLRTQFQRTDLATAEAVVALNAGTARSRPSAGQAVLSHPVFIRHLGESPDGIPQTAFLRAFMTRRLTERPGLSGPELLCEFLFEHLPVLGPTPWPLSAEQIDFLNAPTPATVLPYPVPRIVLWAAMASGKWGGAAAGDYRSDLYCWFVREFLESGRLDPRLLPPAVAAYLRQPTPLHDGLPPLNHFHMRKLVPSREKLSRHTIALSRGAYLGFMVDQLLEATSLRADLLDGADFLMPPEWIAYFGQPYLPARPEGLTRLEMMVYLNAAAARAIDPNTAPWASSATRDWIRAQAARSPGWARLLSIPAAQPIQESPSVRIAGLLDSSAGLGTNLRMLSQELADAGLRHRLTDVRDGRSRVIAPPMAEGTHRDAEIYCIGADILLDSAWRLTSRAGAFKVGYLFWELESVPEEHVAAVDVLDEIWVASEFVRRAYSGKIGKPVVNVGMRISLPHVIPPLDRRERGIPDDAFVFLTAFDFGSGLIRKNPGAAVRAFQKAFPLGSRSDVRLVVKTTRIHHGHWGDRDGTWGWILRAAAADPRIVVLEGEWPEATFLGLMQACDCYVSPHRSEGFGLLPAYAMAMGKPVIVTNYSGTTDFCDETTAIPIDYALVPVAPGQFIADVPGAVWADISIDHLAEAMRRLAEDPATGVELGRAAAQRIATLYAPGKLARAGLGRLAAQGVVASSM